MIDQIQRVASQHFGDSYHPLPGQTAFAEFQMTDLLIERVEAFGQGFLRHAAFFTHLANIVFYTHGQIFPYKVKIAINERFIF